MPPSADDIPLIDSSGRDHSRPLQLVLKNIREQVKDVRKDLEELQKSFNALNYSDKNSERKSIVSFSTIQVREYNVTMGDHRSGPQCPLTLAWEHGPSRTYGIDTFSKKKEREDRNPLQRLPLHKRQDRLRAMGCSRQEITQTSRKQERIRKLALNCAYRPHGSSFPGTTRPRKEAPLYLHGSLKYFQMEDCVASREYIDMEEKITKAGKNFKNASIIRKPIHSKNNSAIAA
jgi:hypothetical protein